MDISRIKSNLMDEYISEDHPTDEQQSAFLLGMVRLESVLFDKEEEKRLNDYVENQSIISILQEEKKQLKQMIQKYQMENQKLKNRIDQILQLDKQGKTELRMNTKYVQIERELTALKRKNDMLIQKLIEYNLTVDE